MQKGHLFLLLLPDAREFGGDLLLLLFGDGIHDSALFVNQAALAQGRWEQSGDGGPQSIMSIGDKQINLAYPPIAQVLEEATPAIFVFLSAGAEGQDCSTPLQIHAERR
jgi:hypothetical protein